MSKDKRADTPRLSKGSYLMKCHNMPRVIAQCRRHTCERRDKGDSYSGERFGNNERFVEPNPIEKFPSGGWIYPTGKGWELTKRDNEGRRKGERRQAT
jgi:hypothetical protein